jgi:transcriptional regulator with XRE-family HTH domain
MITGRQIRAARGLLGWDASELAAKAGLTRETVSKIENESVQAREETFNNIVHAFNDSGVEFIGSIGVQWVQHQSQTLVGLDGLKTFFDDVRYVTRSSGQEVVICGFDEDYFEEKLGEYLNYHRKEMAQQDGVKMRCLIEESDYNLGASDYCRYRWLNYPSLQKSI